MIFYVMEKLLTNTKTKTFRRLRQIGGKLKAEKCILFKPEIKYLGKIISEKDIRTIQSTEKLLKNYINPLKL